MEAENSSEILASIYAPTRLNGVNPEDHSLGNFGPFSLFLKK
jgi:hypothetical protein